MSERRASTRRPLDVYFNKYLDGQPHLCRSVDLSRTGMRALRLSEPNTSLDAFPVELQLPGDPESLWIWARAVRSDAADQGLEFVGIDAADRQRIDRFLAA
ncbi:MAG: PilZ domain-containing protein [Myxococcales bacterium]|nr:PilZ domain-containing protein [Myxococcales bacterium]